MDFNNFFVNAVRYELTDFFFPRFPQQKSRLKGIIQGHPVNLWIYLFI